MKTRNAIAAQMAVVLLLCGEESVENEGVDLVYGLSYNPDWESVGQRIGVDTDLVSSYYNRFTDMGLSAKEALDYLDAYGFEVPA